MQPRSSRRVSSWTGTGAAKPASASGGLPCLQPFRRTRRRTQIPHVLTLVLILLAVVVLVIAGVAIIGLVLKLLWWAIIGLVIGGLAQLVLRDMPSIGWLATIAAGIAGALLGGLAANIFGGNWLLELVLAVAIAALLIAWLGGKRRAFA